MTYDIQNWDEYATDPAVVAWKRMLEAVTGSMSARLFEPVRTGIAKRVLRPYEQSLQNAWDSDWTVEPVGKVRIESATPTGDTKVRLVNCLWDPSVSFYEQAGSPSVRRRSTRPLCGRSSRST